MRNQHELVPLLIVRGAASAIDFYARALGARVSARYEHGTERHVSHADLAVAGAPFSVTEEAPAWNSDAPPSLGGSPVVLQLLVDHAEAMFASMCAAGATAVFPLQELFGERMARLRDPFGHLWLLRERVEELCVEETQRQRDDLLARHGGSANPTQPLSRATAGQDAKRLSDTTPAWQSVRAATADALPGRIHLVLGPVGAGKSTLALELARDRAAVRLTLDDWMTTLFSPDRPATDVAPWYVERAARCVEQVWRVASAAASLGVDVVLEIGLLKRGEREALYRRVDDAKLPLTIYVVDAARDVRRERVMDRNRARRATFSMVVPLEIFELASDLWEPPGPDECNHRDVRFFLTDGR